MAPLGTGDKIITDQNGNKWRSVAFFEGEKGTGDRRGILLPNGIIKEIN